MPVLIDPCLLQDRHLAHFDQLPGQLGTLGKQRPRLLDHALHPGRFRVQGVTLLLELLDLGLQRGQLGTLAAQRRQFGPQRDDRGGQACLVPPQPGNLIAQPGDLGCEVLPLGDTQAVQDLPEPVDLSLQVTPAAGVPFMAAGGQARRGRGGDGAGRPGRLRRRGNRNRAGPGLGMGSPPGAIPPPQQRRILVILIPAGWYRARFHIRSPSMMSAKNRLSPGHQEQAPGVVLAFPGNSPAGQPGNIAASSTWPRRRFFVHT
jgi:hypothetical protein